MNENLKVFENEVFGEIRTTEIDGEPWFVGKDVAQALGYKDTDQAVRVHVYEQDKLTRDFNGSGQNRAMTVINESGLYSLILSSKLPMAKEFTHWVTSEVLPAIRKTGGYVPVTEEMTDDEVMSRALVIAQRTLALREERIRKLQAENKEMLPKAQYFDGLVDRNLLTNFRDTAKELGAKPQQFTAFMEENGYIYHDSHKKIKPVAKYVDDGLFVIKDFIGPYGRYAGTQTLVTPKGKSTFQLLLPAWLEKNPPKPRKRKNVKK